MSNWNYTAEEVIELREKVIIEAKKLLNTPFAHRGRTRFGVDCLGFVYLAYIKAGITGIRDGDGKVYEPNWFWFCDKERYLDNLLTYADFVKEPMRADIVLFRCFKEIVTHGGIYLEDGNFIHAPSGNSPHNRKVRLDNLSHRYWGSSKIFAGYLRFKGFNI